MSRRKILHPGFEKWRYTKTPQGTVARIWRCQARRANREDQCKWIAYKGKNVCGFHGGGSWTMDDPRKREQMFKLNYAKRTTCVGTNYVEDLIKRKSMEIFCLELLGVMLGVFSTDRKLLGNKPKGYPWDIVKKGYLDDVDLIRLLRLTYG